MEKTIIVTGASRGIGRAVTERLIKDKCRVIAIARDGERLRGLASELNDKQRLTTVEADLLDASLIPILHGKLNGAAVDGLVNNAGLLINDPFDMLHMEQWERSYRTNVFAPAMLIQGMLPQLKKAAVAHVVNIGSMGGFQGSAKFPGLAAYSSAKAALACMTECLAAEYAGTNVRFNCLALGAVDTDMLREAFPNYKAPLSAEEMAGFIADFVLNGHRWFNGKVLPVAMSTP